MRLTIETDKDIVSLNIVFSDNTSGNVGIVSKEVVSTSAAATSAAEQYRAESSSPVVAKTTETGTFVVPDTSNRPPVIDDEFKESKF